MPELRELSERYQLKKILRSTRFGSVLRAIDNTTGQPVAIKLIPISSQERLREGEPYFLRLSSTLQALRHPNVPLAVDSGFTTDGSAFLALEWLEGAPLVADGEVPTGRAVAWVLRALSGLEILAARGLAHHNLTTDNLFLAASPEGGSVKLLGLGSAFFRPTGGAVEAGWPPESVRFQSPEFGLVPRNDAQVDIYALACIACDLLGATTPPGDDPAVQLPLAVSFELENELALRRVLEGALRRDPQARPSSRELREALQTAVTGMSAQPESSPLDGTMADLAPPSILDAGSVFFEAPAAPRVASPPRVPSASAFSLPVDPFEAADPIGAKTPSGWKDRTEMTPPLAPTSSSFSAEPSWEPLGSGGSPVEFDPFAALPSDDLLPIFESLLTVEPAPPRTPSSALPDFGSPSAAAASTLPAAPAPFSLPPPISSAPPFVPTQAAPPIVPIQAAPPVVPIQALPPALTPTSPSLPPAGRPPTLPPPPVAAPPALESEGGELLSAIDDEVLNALLAIPPPVDPRDKRTGAAQGSAASLARVVPFNRQAPPVRAAAVPTKPERPNPLRLLRKPAVFGGIAGALVLAGLAAFWLLRRTEAPPPVAPHAQLPAPPTQPPLAELEEAKLQLALGNDFEARKILQGISFAYQGLLPPAQCRELAALEGVLSAASLAQLPTDLAKGLEGGDLRRLQLAVGTADEQGRALALDPAALQNLERAREVVKSYGAAQAASARGSHTDVLEAIAALRKALPKLDDPEKLREKAATALEMEATALAKEARYDEARAKMELIRSAWPERSGLSQRLSALDSYKKNEAAQVKLLAGMNAYERRRKPHEGLEVLRTVSPTPHLEPEFNTARRRLEDQLSRFDGKPPVVVLRDGYYLEFQRGAFVEISVRATDDYQVKSVRMMARSKGGSYREVKLAKSTFGYSAKFTPAFHRNAEVQFYVVATDLSGHEGYYGTPAQPNAVKPQRGFDQILR